MTPELQRIAIATACGWVEIETPVDWLPNEVTGRFTKPHPTKPGQFKIWVNRFPVPDYLNDLNAMHDAERTLSGAQWPVYVKWLCGLTRDRDGEGLVFATATQRAEAFLRTIGKWEEL